MRTAEGGLSADVAIRAPLVVRRGPGVDGLVMLLGVATLLVLVVAPLVLLLLGSVTHEGAFTAEHFAAAFSRPAYYNALLNSLILGVGTAVLSVLIGAPMAWAVSRTTMPAKNLVRVLVGVSYITPPFLSAIAYVILLAPNSGVLNRLVVELFGVERGPFSAFTMWTMIFVTALHTFPYVFLLTSSALESVDASLEESARILGSGVWRNTVEITLPMVTPAILSGALLAFINAISLFGSQAILGLPGRVFTLPTRIQALFTYPPQYGLASALSVVLVLLTVIALYLQRGYLERRSFVTLGGKGVRPELVEIGRWRWPALALCGLVFAAAVFLPYVFLGLTSLSKTWALGLSVGNLTLDNYRFVLFEYEVTRRAIMNSLLLATAAATIAILLGAVLAYVDLRGTVRGRKVLDYLSLMPLGLPGIVLAVGILLVWLRLPFDVYGTLTILLIAYLTRFIPLAVRSANAALRQVDPSLEETARITGASWLETFGRVTLPLTRSGLFAGWILVFVPALQELSASILLFTGPTITLAVAVFNLYDNGLLERVAALAIVNTLIISAALLVAQRLARRGAMQTTRTSEIGAGGG
jgi:iron(III) transport system permease protein